MKTEPDRSVTGRSEGGGKRVASNPFLFAVGCPRSGTTLLQRMLNAHPDLAVAYDTLFIPRVLRDDSDPDPLVSPEMIQRLKNFARFQRFGFGEDFLDNEAFCGMRFSQFVTRVYDEFALMHQKPFGGEKSPGYVRHMLKLHELFPWARFVHLIRDGRNVALSLMDWGDRQERLRGAAAKYALWDECPAAVCALWWEYKALRGRRDSDKMNADAYVEVHYEHLVSDSEQQLRILCDFLGLEFSSAMSNYHEGKTRSRPGLSAKAAWLPPTRGLRDWRTTMKPDDLEIFEALAGDSLERFGYERSCDSISASVQEKAEQYRLCWRERRRQNPKSEHV